MKDRKLKLAIRAMVLTLAITCQVFMAACGNGKKQDDGKGKTQENGKEVVTKESSTPASGQTKGATANQDEIIYENTQYGFRFTLPDTWKGYTIVSDEWEGDYATDTKKPQRGPLLSIRHPKWTEQNPRQDIPIMILTSDQWDSLQNDEIHIGAAPINPSELGRNSVYVFALPARYNFSYDTGYEEVEEILKKDSLKPMKDFSVKQEDSSNKK
jgi:hypothetical protein